MKHILYTYSFLLVGTLISCQQKMKEISIPISTLDLDKAIYLSYKEVQTDYLFSYPECMFFSENNLIVQDRKSTTYLFHSLNITNDSLEYEFCRKGNGPNEFSDATLNPCWNQDKQQLTFFDANKRQLLFYKKSASRFNYISTFSISDIYDSKATRKEYFREILDCGSFYLSVGERGIFDKKRFVILDSTFHIINQIGDYPELSDLLVNPEKDIKKILFSSPFYKIAPNKNKAVFGTYRGALLQFYDLSKLPHSIQNIKSLQLEQPIKKSQITREHDGWVYGFEDIYVTDNSVYAIYNGQTAEDNPLLGKYILVFNWEGQLLRMYQLDLDLRCLAVNEDLKQIFAIGYTNDKGFFLVQMNF